MTTTSRYYDITYKQRVVNYYMQHQPNISFGRVATIFNLKGGESTVRRWYNQRHSLDTKPRSGRPSILSIEEINTHIKKKIVEKNRLSEPIHYTQLLPMVKHVTNKHLSLRTLRRYGKEKCGIKMKRTIKRTENECNIIHIILFLYKMHIVIFYHILILSFFLLFLVVTSEYCDRVAKFRRWCQKISTNKLLYLDETAVRISESERTTLVAPGEKQFVVVEENTSYAARYDMIAVCNNKQVLPPIVYSPEDRIRLKVHGITTKMIVDYVEEYLHRYVSSLDLYPLFLIIDQSSTHSREKLLEAFHSHGCEEIADVLFMPTKSAKRLSPLDNGIFAYWKNKVRQNEKITKNNIISIMTKEWENIPPNILHSAYKHCSLIPRSDVYKDCTNPHVHIH